MGCNSSAYILLKLFEMLKKIDMGNWKSKKSLQVLVFQKIGEWKEKIAWRGINWGVGLVVYWPNDEVLVLAT
jgi:phosphoribosylaminoimidazole (AIR) synthetase